ncbi:hypothetical protein BpHYR1_048552, partial [Brachionus plicatilis]
KSINKLKDFVNTNQIQVRSSSFIKEVADLNKANGSVQNVASGSNNHSELTSPIKVNFDLNDSKFFSPHLSRILEESNSERSNYFSEYTSSRLRMFVHFSHVILQYKMYWAAVKHGRSERGQNQAARPAIKNLDRQLENFRKKNEKF